MTPPQPGDCIAQKYRLVERLARGGMGAVWRAVHLDLETEVALKFLRHEFGADERAEARFRREAQAAARLKSRHTVHIYDYGSHEGRAYIAMELLDGEDLEQHLGHGALSGKRAFSLLQEAARGLSCAHEAGLIHRDIKPSNLFLAREGSELVLKLLDFGIAKSADAASGETTAAGEVFGSPAYMSPEQARGGPVGAVGDLWSLAAVFYRMLTGRPPFQGENASDIVVKVCTEDPTAPSELMSSLGPDVDEFFRRALSRDQAQRFQSTDELLDAARRLELGAVLEESGSLRVQAEKPIPVGRVSETLPLAVAAVESDGAPELKTTSGGKAKQSSPVVEAAGEAGKERPPNSTSGDSGSAKLKRTVILGGFLGLTAMVVAWALSDSGQVTPPSEQPLESSAAISQDEPRRDSLGSVQEEETHMESAAPKANAATGEGSKAELGASAQGATKRKTPRAPSRPAPNEKKMPAPAAAEIGTDAVEPPSSSKQPLPPQERAPTDPVFGIPVASP